MTDSIQTWASPRATTTVTRGVEPMGCSTEAFDTLSFHDHMILLLLRSSSIICIIIDGTNTIYVSYICVISGQFETETNSTEAKLVTGEHIGAADTYITMFHP